MRRRWRARSRATRSIAELARRVGRRNRDDAVDAVLVDAAARSALRAVYERVIASRADAAAPGVGMKIAIRDDDTCYFTSPAELERVYGDVWQRVPVCLATVPFAVGYQRAGIPESEWHSGRALSARRESGAGGVASGADRRAARHGRAARLHARGLPGRIRVSGGARSRSARRRRARVSRARARRADPRVRAAAQRAVEARPRRRRARAGLDVLGSFLSFRPSNRPWDRRDAGELVAHSTVPTRDRAARAASRSSIRTRCDTGVTPSSAVTASFRRTTLEQLIAGLEEARRFGGDFCLATHYWEVDARLKDILLRFLDYAERVPDVAIRDGRGAVRRFRMIVVEARELTLDAGRHSGYADAARSSLAVSATSART